MPSLIYSLAIKTVPSEKKAKNKVANKNRILIRLHYIGG